MSLAFRRFSLLAALALLAAFAPFARPALAATYTVDSLADNPNAGTLRWAIGQANSNPGQDTITFSVVGTITLGSPLPPLTDQAGVIIDGRDASGAPTIEISGGGAVADGIQIASKDNIVRGLIINGFSNGSSGSGINISGTSATNNLIEQNYIGTNSAGDAAGFTATNNNRTAGIYIQFGASNNTINNNVISGNRGYGVYIHTSAFSSTSVQQGNTISNNKIGVSADGSAALGNGQDGVYIGDNSNTNTVGPGNVIGANGTFVTASYGVTVSGQQLSGTALITGNRVIGNKIGTNAAGSAALPNAAGGVYVGKSNGTAIGGPNGNAGTPGGDGNLISGNAGSGVDIQDDSLTANGVVGLVVQNNWIGVDAGGNAALQNTEAGVIIWKQASAVTIGPSNVISGNKLYGVWLLGARNQADPSKQTRSNTIAGNIIGAGADGTTPVPNGFFGIQVEGGTTGNTINGNNSILKNTAAGVSFKLDDSTPPAAPTNNTISGNQISGNGATGVALLVGSGTTIGPGNTISGHSSAGVQIESAQNIVKGNTISGNQIGVNITNGASGNVVGGASQGDGNNLINNTLNGVLVSGAGTTGNQITHTTTNGNGGKGIALTGGGNLGDQPNRPGLSGLSISGNTLSGTVTNASSCGASCTIEVFTDDNPLTDEGPTFVTSFPSAGSFSNISIAGCKPNLIFTITDSANNTSEFISPFQAPAGACVSTAPAVALSDATPSPSQGALPGASVVFAHTVTNTGTGGGALTISHASSNSWTTALDTSACPATLGPGQSCQFTLTVTVPGNAQQGELNDTTITASIAGAPAPAQKTDRTSVLLNAGLTFVPEPPGSNAKTVGSGQPVSYQHKLTNTGNGPDSFDIAVTPPSGWTYSVQPASPIALAQGASTTVTVVLTPTAGIAPGAYDATVTATSHSSASVSQSVTDTTTITAAAVPQISSVVTPASVDQGGAVTITYTIANVGNQDGAFDLTFTPPVSWTVATSPPLSVTVNFGTSQPVDVVLQAPPDAIAGLYTVALTATATTTPNAAATKIDQIAVNQQAALVWSPDLGPFARPPAQTVTDTLTLTNTGNFTDTVSLTASSSRGWIVQPIPPSVTLNPGANTQVDVRMIIPPGEVANISNTTYVTATSQLPQVTATARITTTIAAVPGVTLTPSLQAKTIESGKPMTYTFTLQNSGSISQTYTISNTNPPAGWTHTLTPLITLALQPGATQLVTFTLQPPANTPDGTQASVDIIAKCNEDACADAKATAQLTVGPLFGVGAGGLCNGSALPGAMITCVHTISNTGSSADNYVLTTLSPLGWRTTVTPPSILLAPGASGTFAVTLAVPSSADAGLVHNLMVKARSTAAPSISSQLIDTTTVLQVAGVSFSPGRSAPAIAGREVQFQHEVLNTGNGPDSYTISATQDANWNWNITIVPTQTQALARGSYQPVLVKVQVPLGVPARAINHITVKATSKFAPSVSSQLVDTVGLAGAPNRFIYMPIMLR